MIAAVTATGQPDARPGGTGKAFEQRRCDSGACTFQTNLGAVSVDLGLIPDSF